MRGAVWMSCYSITLCDVKVPWMVGFVVPHCLRRAVRFYEGGSGGQYGRVWIRGEGGFDGMGREEVISFYFTCFCFRFRSVGAASSRKRGSRKQASM